MSPSAFSQLFALDAGFEGDSDQEVQSIGSDNDSPETSDDEAASSASDGSSSSSSSDASGPSQAAAVAPSEDPSAVAGPSRPKPVWTDPSLATLLVPLVGPQARAPDGSFAGTKRLRKLRVSKDEQSVSGKEYEKRLRQMYERLHPRPAWASGMTAGQTSASPAINGATSSGDKPTVERVASLSELLARDTGLVADAGKRSKKRSTLPLPSGTIELERLRDVSHTTDSDLMSAIESLDFYPGVRSNGGRLLMTGSRDRRVRLYNVDGSSNPLMQTIHVPSLPLSNAKFHPEGHSVLISGPRPYLYSYDLEAGRILRSTPWRGSGGESLVDEDSKERDLSMSRFAPLDSSGHSSLLAVGGRRGAVHLLDWSRSSAAGGGGSGSSIVATLRQNTPLAGMDWDHSDSSAGRRLVSLGIDGTLSLWDARSLRCEVVKRDSGLFGANSLSASSQAGWWAVGSESGIVNMYNGEDLWSGAAASKSTAMTNSAAGEQSIEAQKSVSNLITSTTTLRFGCPATARGDSQILAFSSRSKKDALRLLHLPSLTVFSNWPTSGTPLGHVSDVAHSADGKVMAIGNTRGRTLLFGLKHM